MSMSRRNAPRPYAQCLSIVLLSAASLALGACSSALGGGSSPPQTVVLPAGTTIVCSDGTAPPCR